MSNSTLTSQPLRLGLVGATGAMGQRVLRLLPNMTRLKLNAAWVREASMSKAERLLASVAVDALCTSSAADFAQQCDIVVDFSAPSQCRELAPHLARAQVAYVVASTGLDEACEQALNDAAHMTCVLQAANLSAGVQVMLQMAQQAASILAQDPDWDVEIVEMHHRRKVDGPSGTALALGHALDLGAPDLKPIVGRGTQAVAGRPPRQLGYSVVRGGDVAGEHTVYFLGQGERLELTHRSQSADIFARGALMAALRLYGMAKGRYSLHQLPPAVHS